MVSNETQRMALDFNKMARIKFQDRLEGFCILNVNDDVNNRAFSIEFIAYDYFLIRLNYEKGRFGCCIVLGNKTIELPNTQKWWDEANFDTFFKELKEELELRIPDKFLKSRGWL